MGSIRSSSKDSEKLKRYIALAAVAAYIANKLRRHGLKTEAPQPPPERFAWAMKARLDHLKTIEEYFCERKTWKG